MNKPLIATLDCTIAAAKGEGEEKSLPRVDIVGYNGGKMAVGYWGDVVIDLAGLKAKDAVPILLNHDAWTINAVLGMTDAVENDGKKLKLSGAIMADDDISRPVLSLARNGYKFQASVGVTPSKYKEVDAGDKVEVNGRTLAGPFTLVQASELNEISIVPLGADGSTSARIAAEQKREQEQKMSEKAKDTAPESAVTAETVRAAAVAEELRIGKVREIAKDYPDVSAKAVADGWTPERTETEALRARAAKLEGELRAEKERSERPKVDGVIVKEKPALNGSVLTAAIVQAGGIPRTRQEKLFNADTLTAAHDAFGGKLGLQQLIVTAAQANGYSGSPFLRSTGDLKEAIRAAFSTTEFASTLSNAMNMFILDAFNAVEQEWAKIAKVNANVNDFREYETYADISDLTFDELAPNGKIAHGKGKDSKYTNQVDTLAKIIQIGRKDIVNDNIGIVQAMAAKLGRGGAIKLNKVFWTAFLSNSPVFYSEARGNLVTGEGIDNDGLEAAYKAFDEQTDPNGDPLGVSALYLVVGPDLQFDAQRFMNSPEIVIAGSTANVLGSRNIFAGRSEVVKSQYQTETGAYWLVADPASLPVIEVGFLRGATSPTVEVVEPDSDELGMAMRGFWDFGVNKQVYQAAVKVTAES